MSDEDKIEALNAAVDDLWDAKYSTEVIKHIVDTRIRQRLMRGKVIPIQEAN